MFYAAPLTCSSNNNSIEFATNKYVASPIGNGLDTHRFWEAQYLGVTPVVEHSSLDELYRKTGNVLFVDKYADLTEEVLAKNYPGFEISLKERGTNVPEIATKGYWRRLIEQTRKNAIQTHGLQDATPRKRCWGLTLLPTYAVYTRTSQLLCPH